MMLGTEQQLGLALEAFAYARQLEPTWAPTYLDAFVHAGITSVADLATGCQDETINMDLDFTGISKDKHLDADTQKLLYNFLPGPVGLRCFRLAQRAAEHVDSGRARTNYVHRPESGKVGDERFLVATSAANNTTHTPWTLNVDCAGFVRSVLQHVTKSLFQVSLSDRSFMRAKDFFRFFETIDITVLDKQDMEHTDERIMKWRIVPDLRMVIPGDVIVWRPKGNAAGHCAFTSNDRTDLRHLLKAVKTAQLWNEESKEKGLVTRHVGRDPEVKAYVDTMQKQLNAIGIHSCTEFRATSGQLNTLLSINGYEPIDETMLGYMMECAHTMALNTGHIVFASGKAVHMGGNEYRIKVVHSTKSGKKDEHGNITEGVQEYYRRFQLIENDDGTVYWMRPMKQSDPLPENRNNHNDGDSVDDDDVDGDDPEDTDTDVANDAPESNNDELAGCTNVEVLAARMCF